MTYALLLFIVWGMKRYFIALIFLFNFAASYSLDIIYNDQYQANNSYSAAARKTFNPRNMIIFGTALSTSFLADGSLQDYFVNNQSESLSAYSNIGNEFGETSVMLPALAASWAVGFSSGNDRLTTTALNSGKAFLAGAVITESIKTGTGRFRPYAGDDPYSADPLEGDKISKKSFPSWHSFVSWSIITPFAEEYSRWLYLVPVSTSFARLYQNMHWTSDVVMGAGIGLFSGLFFHTQSKVKMAFSGNSLIINY